MDFTLSEDRGFNRGFISWLMPGDSSITQALLTRLSIGEGHVTSIGVFQSFVLRLFKESFLLV
jgi:hypothetical protein